MVELYRLKDDTEPIEVNQVRPETVEAVALWCNGVAVKEHDAFRHETTYAAINVPTKNGMARAQEDDWIVRGPEGYFYVVKDRVFHELFELIK